MDKAEIMRELKALGADQAYVRFTGGNDEGGPDRIDLYKDAVKVKDLEPYVAGGRYDYDTGEYVYDDEDSRKRAALITALCQPIYDRWGSFAGEFSVYGTVTYDVSAVTVTLDYDESVETYESHSSSW